MRRSGLFWGTVLIVIGGLLLLNNLGIVKVSFSVIWPLFLILLGLWALLGPFLARGSVETQQISIPLEGANRARVRLRHGAGRVRVDASAAMGDLISGTCIGGAEFRTRRDGDKLDVKLRLPRDFFPFPWTWGGASGFDWSVGLSGSIPLELDIEGGASESHFDLTNLRVTDLRIESGASSIELTMPANAGVTKAKLEGGATSMKIRIPEGVAARIRAEGGVSDIAVDSARFPRTGQWYQSPDYEGAANRIEMDIEVGAGSVKVS